MDDDTITRVLVKGSRAIYFSIRTTTSWRQVLLLEGPVLNRNCCSSVAGLVGMGAGYECRGLTFRTPAYILRIFLSIKGVPMLELSVLTSETANPF